MPQQKNTGTGDLHRSKRHNIYAPAWVMEAADKLAEINKSLNRKGQNRSQITVNELKKLLRVNAPRLRKAGYRLPEGLFEKEPHGGWRKYTWGDDRIVKSAGE